MVYLNNHVIEAEVSTGVHAGKRLFIRIIILVTNDNQSPLILKWKQFTVKLAFGIIVYKSQWQTLQSMRLYFHEDIFCHGQLFNGIQSRTELIFWRKIITKTHEEVTLIKLCIMKSWITLRSITQFSLGLGTIILKWNIWGLLIICDRKYISHDSKMLGFKDIETLFTIIFVSLYINLFIEK